VIPNEQLFLLLPMLSGNFGMVIAEALACGTPVITTKGVPWQELETTQSGWWIDIGADALKQCLEEVLKKKSTDELNAMGVRGSKLIEDNYSIDSVAQQMMSVYEWCLSGENPPDCMQFWKTDSGAVGVSGTHG